MRTTLLLTLLVSALGSAGIADAVCGDQLLDAGEQCDDGNVVSGDCCAADCTAEAAGTPCPQIDLCLEGTCSGFGYCEYTDSCADHPLLGTKLILKKRGTREKLVWLARDSSLSAPDPGSADDPSVAGATLELFAPFETSAAMSIPAGTGHPGWSSSSGTNGARWKFVNPSAPSGGSPVKVAVLKGGSTLKVVAKNAGFPLDQLLSGVGIRLVVGTRAYCSYFHVGTVLLDQPGLFKAANAGTAPACDRGSLGAGSPSGAFVD